MNLQVIFHIIFTVVFTAPAFIAIYEMSVFFINDDDFEYHLLRDRYYGYTGRFGTILISSIIGPLLAFLASYIWPVVLIVFAFVGIMIHLRSIKRMIKSGKDEPSP